MKFNQKEKFNELKINNYKPNKILGQNFLVDKNALAKIIKAGSLKKGERAVEIGAGTGILTKGLLEQGAKVIAFEKDKNLIKFLSKKFVSYLKNGRLELNARDFLLFDLGKVKKPYKIVANIPYYLTGRIIRKLIEESNKPKLAVLMLQKEVGERILAKPPKATLLSNLVGLVGKAKKVAAVKAGSFYPKPKVDSVILKIKFNKKSLNYNLIKVIKAGFRQPRKTLLNNLRVIVSKEKLLEIFKGLRISSNQRPAEIEPEKWLKLTKLIN